MATAISKPRAVTLGIRPPGLELAWSPRKESFAVIDAGLVVKLLLLLLIGIGPKVALVPFLEKTKHLDAETQRAVGRRMVATAVVTAIVLFATGWLLLRLLHLSGGAVAVGGAIVLAILAINMAAGPTKKVEEVVEIREDPKQIAVYPLAVPYLLNPVGITILIIASGEIVLFASAALVLGLVLLVGAVDYLISANIDKLSKRLNPSAWSSPRSCSGSCLPQLLSN